MPQSQKQLPSVSLAYKEAGSDKVYNVQIVRKGDLYVVNFQYGRRGQSLQSGTKTSSPVELDKANKIFAKIVSEKKAKGYSEGGTGTPYVGSENAGKVSGFIPQLLNFVKDEQELAKYLADSTWMMQEKHDGVNYSLRKKGETIEGINRKGLVVDVPETILASARAIPMDFLICGERIGNTLYAFDLIELGGKDWRKTSAKFRWAGLVTLPIDPNGHIEVVRTYFDKQDKLKAFKHGQEKGVEGFVFKKMDATFSAGRPASGGNQLKYKFYASGTFKVLAVSDKRSVEVGALVSEYKDEYFTSVGKVTIPSNHEIPKLGQLVEVEYLYAFPDGGSLFQSIYHGQRTDKDSADLYTTLKFKPANEEE